MEKDIVSCGCPLGGDVSLAQTAQLRNMAFLFPEIIFFYSQLTLALWLPSCRSYRFDRDRQTGLGFICDKMYPYKGLFTQEKGWRKKKEVRVKKNSVLNEGFVRRGLGAA